MDFEKSEGKALLCVACPRSDMTIEADVDVDEDIPVHPVDDYTGTVVTLEDIATDIRRVVVELDRDLAFNAGQYMRFEIPGAPGVDRTYSMANVPTEPRRLEFHIRRTPGGIVLILASGPKPSVLRRAPVRPTSDRTPSTSKNAAVTD